MASLIFFLLSLQSVYSYELNMPIVSVGALALIVAWTLIKFGKNVFIIDGKTTGCVLGFYVFLLVWNFLGLLTDFSSPNIKRLFGFLIIFLAVISVEKFLFHQSEMKIIKKYLILHLTFFYIQLFSHYAFGIQIDYLKILAGYDSRFLSDPFNLKFFGDFIRPSGLFIEPGTYACFIAPFVALFLKYYKDCKLNKIVFWFGLISLFLSGSSFGLIFGVLILISIKEINFLIKILITFFPALYIFPYFYHRYWVRESGHGLDIRENFVFDIINYCLTNIDGLIFGVKNILSLELKIPFSFVSDNDLGVLGYLLFSNGLVGGIFIILMVIYIYFRLKIAYRISFIIIIFSKVSIFAPFFPFMLGLVIYKGLSKKSPKY